MKKVHVAAASIKADRMQLALGMLINVGGVIAITYQMLTHLV